MNARKRSGDSSLLDRPSKQRRLAMRAPDGDNPSPGGSGGDRLRARWAAHFRTGLKNSWSFAQGTVDLVFETLLGSSPTLPMHNTDVNVAAVAAVPAERPLPTPPTTPPSSNSGAENPSPSIPRASTSSEVDVRPKPAPTPDVRPKPAPTHSPFVFSKPQSEAASIPWPSTANTQTPYPEIDAQLRRHQRETVRRQHKRGTRDHIFAKKHKMHVQAAIAGAREELLKELYVLNQRSGYNSDFSTFKGFVKKQALIKRYMRSRSSSMTDISRQTKANPDDDTDFLRRAIEKAQATLNGPKPLRPLTPSINQLQLRYRTKDEELDRRLRRPSLPSSLPPKEDEEVSALLRKRGLISKYAKEQVSDADIVRLNPAKWLNDEVINFYGALILGRSESSKENPSGKNKGKKPLDVHYFSTFFWTKLEKEGYEKGRLAKWTKKIDIFSKDTILIPVNHQNIHWTAAAINFRQKRIESFDSMHDARERVFKLLRQYLDLEHRNKKKTPFDFTGWEDYTSEDTPWQENGYDCGVFTCQFLESLSRGEESFNFSQKDIPYLRRRMIWEIAHAQLRTET